MSRKPDLGDMVSILVETAIRLARNDPDMEFCALQSAAAFAAIVSETTEDAAVEYLRDAYKIAAHGRAIQKAGGFQ